MFHSPDIYLTGTVDIAENRVLQLIAKKLELQLNTEQIIEIVQHKTPAEIEDRRSVIRRCLTDAERLLSAVGEQRLRKELPDSLLAALEKEDKPLTEHEVSEIAISMFHTDAFKRYKWALDHLDPPSEWAGSARAVKFVPSLGFSNEWAGEQNRRLEPFLQVEGRYQLPPLHSYQKTVVSNIRKLICNRYSNNSTRRGMIRMPTGSRKTRVVVQAVVEAMNDDGFGDGVHWVADRSELCEQAVEAWIKLIVFDEAHRSIAPTFTSVMNEIGSTRRQESNELFLLGLTATPYRGYNKEETKWLVNRYGNNRLDTGAFDNDDVKYVVQQLQDINVLAQADHETIEGETISIKGFFGVLSPRRGSETEIGRMA